MMESITQEKKEKIRGPSLMEFFKGSSDFPAFHFHDLMTDYGDVVQCGPYFYLINHPDIAKEILNRDQKDFSQKDFIGRRVTTMFGHGMVTSQGKLWSSQRRILNPVFSHKSLHEQIETVVSQIDSILETWNEHVENKEQVDIADLMGTLTILISGQLLFRFDFSKYVSEFKKIVEFGTGYIAEGLPFFLPTWLPSRTHFKLKKISKRTDEILEHIISECKSKDLEHPYMAGVLMEKLGNNNSSSFEKRVLLDEMKTMLAGGYFPVSCSLSMIWYTLGQFPEYFPKMKEEIRSKPKDFQFDQNFYKDFPVTTAIIFEVMRLYPVAFSIWRKAKVDFETHGYVIPKGKSICVSLFNIHRHPDFWIEPNEFIPERFMDDSGDKRPKHHFMPFGWGNRKCIGDHYAIMVIFLTVIRTIQHYDIEIIHEVLKVRRAALICPKRVNANIKAITK